MRFSPRRWHLSRLAVAIPLVMIVALTLWRLLMAWLMPVVQDEAYYYDWSQALGWGYFDHPPAVALLGVGRLFVADTALAARLGVLLLSTLTLLALLRFYRACGLRSGLMLSMTLLLAAAAFPVLISGVITTPDTLLALCWVLALQEALAALQGQRWRWLGAGLATGIGLLSKYTMVIIGPVFLLSMLMLDRRALRSPWPYLGGLVALLIFLPNLIWNAQHDWLTLRFQFGHGFMTDTGALSLPIDVLLAEPAMAVGEHANSPLEGDDRRYSGIGGFVATQALFWGLPLIVVLAAVGTGRRWVRSLAELRQSLTPHARVLLFSAAVVPLLLFGVVEAVSSVEANWAALYILGAAPLVAAASLPLWRWAVVGAIANIALMSLYALHAATAVLPLPNAADRILRETHGYRALAAHVDGLDVETLFADRYQTAAMLNFYGAGPRASQWPGLTRPSEYGLGRIVPIPRPEALQSGGFTLVVWKFAVPDIAGFERVDAQTLFDCRGMALHVEAGIQWPDASPCGDDWLHVWRVLRYEPRL